MKAGIISAGFNKRLKSAGVPKGLIKINGKTIIETKLTNLEKIGFHEVFIIIRKDSTKLRDYLNKISSQYLLKIIIIEYDSISPLDSTLTFKNYINENEGILVFNVDAIFNYKDLERFVNNIKENQNQSIKDMVMWASPINEKLNEDPAYIKFNDKLHVLEYGKQIEPTKYVFGQVRYCSHRVLNIDQALCSNKNYKMHKYISYLIKNNFDVSVFKTREFTFDIDTPDDLINVSKIVNNEKL